jgi:hypothetical protein
MLYRADPEWALAEFCRKVKDARPLPADLASLPSSAQRE